MPISAEQCRAARALLGWSRSELSRRSIVASSTLGDFEAGKREPHVRTLTDIRRAFDEAGVTFIPSDKDGGPGARLTRAAAE